MPLPLQLPDITGLAGEPNTYNDETLGRVEVGGSYALTDNFSAYIWTNHTFSDSYRNTSGGLGVELSW